MLPIHTILHPTDFSDRSTHALHLACALARDYGARLIILHVATTPTIAYGEGVVPPDPETLFEAERELLERLTVPDPAVAVERRFEEGDPIADILRVAQESHADLIVMGTHGRTGLSRLLMGSVAEQVVRRASCPVLTVTHPFAVPATAEMPEAALAAGGAI
jgi:nucleotide-binding universal stress UspA family protein